MEGKGSKYFPVKFSLYFVLISSTHNGLTLKLKKDFCEIKIIQSCKIPIKNLFLS